MTEFFNTGDLVTVEDTPENWESDYRRWIGHPMLYGGDTRGGSSGTLCTIYPKDRMHDGVNLYVHRIVRLSPCLEGFASWYRKTFTIPTETT